MKNGYLHDWILIQTEQSFRALGGEITREYPVTVCGRRGWIDRLIRFRACVLAVEAETTGSRRVPWDADKAQAVGASGLFILTPTTRIATACRQRVRRRKDSENLNDLWICVLTLGAFPQWLRTNSCLFSPSFEASKTLSASEAGRPASLTHYSRL
jgi:hypothetical protein